MVDFKYYAPTEIAFGKDSEGKIPSLLHKYGATKVLVHFGGKSALRSGLIGEIREMLQSAGIQWVELGGVVPNPLVSLVREGVGLCRKEGVDFILAVGGGSVIDSAKAIGYGVCYNGDVWDIYAGLHKPEACLPIGAVLTIPAAGSEMSDSSVISNEDTKEKKGCNSDLCRCRFAVMNPVRTFTLPPYQTAAGVTDIMMHTMERYFSNETDMALTDAIAEALMRTVKDYGLKVVEHPDDYVARAQIMWASSLAHNDLTGCGLVRDFATHKMEHELSALYGVTHGAGLAALWSYWAAYVLPGHEARFAQFARNVLGVGAADCLNADVPVEASACAVHPADDVIPAGNCACQSDAKACVSGECAGVNAGTPAASQKDSGTASDTAIALAGIEAMKDFYRKIGMPTNVPELIGRKATAEEIAHMADRCTNHGTFAIGGLRKLSLEDVTAIYTAANEE